MRRRFASCIGSVHPLLREAPNGVLRNIVGGVVSPLLANIFLHYVLDEWFEKEVRPRLQGEAFVIRYADDCAPRRCERTTSGVVLERHAA